MTSFDERYLVAYLCNQKKIADFETILNFHTEISDISLKSHDIKAFQIKLQWFMEAMQSENHTGHPIVDKTKAIIKTYNLKIDGFLTLLESKNIDLDQLPFQSLQKTLIYAQNTGGFLWKTAESILCSPTVIENTSIEKIGTAFTILGIIRNAPYMHQKNIYPLCYSEKELNNSFDENIKKNVIDLIQMSELLIKEANDSKKKLRKKNKKLFLLNVFTEQYIKNIIATNYNLTNTTINKLSKFTYLKLLRNYIFKL